MSLDTDWNVDKYKESHESDDHWKLRKAFLIKWKDHYPEDRLLCLARVFANIEFLGCRYPQEVMLEVASLSKEVAKQYRNEKRGKLQRTFVAASTMAEDRAKGVKRKGGIVENTPSKSSKINFVPQGTNDFTTPENDKETTVKVELKDSINNNLNSEDSEHLIKQKSLTNTKDFINDLLNIKRLDAREFDESMFNTSYGRLLLLIRPWAGKLWNIQASCQACKAPLVCKYKDGTIVISIRGKVLAEAKGSTKAEAKSIAQDIAWKKLSEQSVMLLVKEQWIAQGDSPISVSDITGPAKQEYNFGTPIENSVALKMMKMMGWQGGGLGADSQGIEEPIKPKMQMVNRAGLGSDATDVKKLKKAGYSLMQRFRDSDSFDVDLVFSSDFTKEERAMLHSIAKHIGLASKSYGDVDRFLVVKKKVEPFSLFLAVVSMGGETNKYQTIIPASIRSNGR